MQLQTTIPSKMYECVRASALLGVMSGNWQKVPHTEMIVCVVSYTSLHVFVWRQHVRVLRVGEVRHNRGAGIRASGKVTLILNKQLKLEVDCQKNISSLHLPLIAV